MKRFLFISFFTVYSGAFADTGFDISKYEKKFEELYQMHAKECSPVELAKAEVYFEILKSNLTRDKQNDSIIKLKPSSVESVSYPKNLDFYISSIEKNIYSDKDGDGIPCYKEIELGLDPDVFDKLDRADERLNQDYIIAEQDSQVAKNQETVSVSQDMINPLNQPVRVHFYFNRADIKKEYLPYLNVVAKFMKTHPSVKVKIVGYTDDVGSKNYNDKLATKRALSVKNYLVKQGIEPSRIVIEGVGKSRYIVANDSSIDRFTNRRAEFYVIKLAD